jgi:hypothetical protein
MGKMEIVEPKTFAYGVAGAGTNSGENAILRSYAPTRMCLDGRG